VIHFICVEDSVRLADDYRTVLSTTLSDDNYLITRVTQTAGLNPVRDKKSVELSCVLLIRQRPYDEMVLH